MGATAAEWDDFRSKKLLRVLPGDVGFVNWTQAKLSFFEDIKAAVREYFDTQEGEDTAVFVQDVESSFPLVLERF